ncbi:hypothetical protein PsorP6_015047 [Peronosclerospora sorghi]|uniref:Uncharacterized protein n=1 Tax=Peronosclerospora sorghi TaxID=230839 RepID=A0ACC0VU01_9STRA|nr:hypothetical protein PsorP6_015047 [Peronosclerospora sorghi]
MENDKTNEQQEAATSMPLLDEIDLLQTPTTDETVNDMFLYFLSPSMSQTDVYSQSQYNLKEAEPVGLTADEACELLKDLGNPEVVDTSSEDNAIPGKIKSRSSLLQKQKQRRKAARKNTIDPRTGKMKNPSRERVQNEIVCLRNTVTDLEGQLKLLQQEKSLDLSLTNLKYNRQDEEGVHARVWQQIAQRQAQSRDMAESENMRLKILLQGQIQLAQRLKNVLDKQPNVSVFSDAMGDLKKKRHCLSNESSSSMYELFLSELDGLHAEVDEIFRLNGMEKSFDDSLRKAYVRTRKDAEGQDELFAELKDVNIIPFEFSRASSAMWYAVKRQYYSNCYHLYQGGSDDTIAVNYRSEIKHRGVETWIDALMVMRRYVEPHRVAIVWRSISRGEDAFSGMYTDETGWSVMKQIPPDSGVNVSGCVMQNCVHIVPKRIDYRTSMARNEMGLLTNLVIDSYEDNVNALSVMVEDLLLLERN